jgi:hypothetical protein
LGEWEGTQAPQLRKGKAVCGENSRTKPGGAAQRLPPS